MLENFKAGAGFKQAHETFWSGRLKEPKEKKMVLKTQRNSERRVIGFRAQL